MLFRFGWMLIFRARWLCSGPGHPSSDRMNDLVKTYTILDYDLVVDQNDLHLLYEHSDGPIMPGDTVRLDRERRALISEGGGECLVFDGLPIGLIDVLGDYHQLTACRMDGRLIESAHLIDLVHDGGET